jgi:hypothetical protein
MRLTKPGREQKSSVYDPDAADDTNNEKEVKEESKEKQDLNLLSPTETQVPSPEDSGSMENISEENDDEESEKTNMDTESMEIADPFASSDSNENEEEIMDEDLVKPTTGESPVATGQWQQEVRKERPWDHRKLTVEKIKKDQWAFDKDPSSEKTIPCPRCGSENDIKHRYCRRCGDPISKENYAAYIEAKVHNKKGLEASRRGQKR